jgi:hypothetical protein
MTQPFLALITPIGSDAQPPLGIWGGRPPAYVDIGGPGPQPTPTPPIYMPPGQPPGYWGGVAPPLPTHPIAPGGPPPGYWGGVAPPLPSHPIAPGGQPPGIWGGRPPYVDIGGPGPQPTPTPPIYFPPEGSGGTPTHPIVLPPDLPEEIPDLGPVDWKVGWTAQTGWIVVGVPNNPAVTPSR